MQLLRRHRLDCSMKLTGNMSEEPQKPLKRHRLDYSRRLPGRSIRTPEARLKQMANREKLWGN